VEKPGKAIYEGVDRLVLLIDFIGESGFLDLEQTNRTNNKWKYEDCKRQRIRTSRNLNDEER